MPSARWVEEASNAAKVSPPAGPCTPRLVEHERRSDGVSAGREGTVGEEATVWKLAQYGGGLAFHLKKIKSIAIVYFPLVARIWYILVIWTYM